MQVGGDVEAVRGTLVHPADAAGGKDRDSRLRGGDHGGGNGGGAAAPAGNAGGKVGAAELGHVARLCQRFQLRVAQPDAKLPVEDGDGGRHRAGGAHVRLDPAGGFKVLRPRHAMGENRAFERDDCLALLAGTGHFGRQRQNAHDGSFRCGRQP